MYKKMSLKCHRIPAKKLILFGNASMVSRKALIWEYLSSVQHLARTIFEKKSAVLMTLQFSRYNKANSMQADKCE